MRGRKPSGDNSTLAFSPCVRYDRTMKQKTTIKERFAKIFESTEELKKMMLGEKETCYICQSPEVVAKDDTGRSLCQDHSELG